MNLNHLRIFNMVMQEKSFSRAAKNLGVSQPAVTSQIGRMEREYDIYLFERGAAGAIPTLMAERLYDLTKDLYDLESKVTEFLSADRKVELSQLRITTASPQLFMPLISQFKKQHPQVKLNVHVAGTNEALETLLNRDADIGLLPLEKKDSRLNSFPYRYQQLKLMVSHTHPLSKCATVSVRDLKHYPLIMRAGGSFTQRLTEKALKSVGGKPLEAAYVFSSREAVMEAVANDLGVGFTLEWDFSDHQRIAIVGFEEEFEGEWESVVWMHSRSNVPGVQSFIRMAEAQSLPVK